LASISRYPGAMKWVGRSHPLELVASWGAPTVLAAAATWSASAVGLPLAGGVAAGAVGLAVGILAMRMAGPAGEATQADFVPAELEFDQFDELLLDDPLIEVTQNSRVVKLFDRQEPTPGELVLRISDYLSEQGRPPIEAAPPIDLQPVDASAALHAALANIRASLR
jgi:hypothetical protein